MHTLTTDSARHMLSLLSFITGILGLALGASGITCNEQTGYAAAVKTITFDLCKVCDNVRCKYHTDTTWIYVIYVLALVSLMFACFGPVFHIFYVLERTSVLRIYAASLVYFIAGVVGAVGSIGFLVMATKRIQVIFNFETSVLLFLFSGPVEVFSGLCLVMITQLHRMHLET